MVDKVEASKIAEERVVDVFPIPPNSISSQAKRDIGYAAEQLDLFLRGLSNNYLTLERLQAIAGSLPIVGNVMAAIDLIGDLIILIQEKSAGTVQTVVNWVSLAINAIGIIPAPPTFAPMRMGMRPLVQYLKQQVKHNIKEAERQITQTVVNVLTEHIQAQLKQSLEDFVKEAKAKLPESLTNGGTHVEKIARHWATILRGIPAAFQKAQSDSLKYDAKQEYKTGIWSAALSGLKVIGLRAAALAFERSGVQNVLNVYAGQLENIGGVAKSKLQEQGNAATAFTIAWFIDVLAKAIPRMPVKPGKASAVISSGKAARVSRKKGKRRLAVLGKCEPGQADANCCKQTGAGAVSTKATGKGKKSINFATGSETIIHTDFELPGVMPIVWSRTYYSRLGAYDFPLQANGQSATSAWLGARWISPYTTCIEQKPDGSLVYYAADGRSHTFPALKSPSGNKPGQSHFNGIENLTLARASATVLVLGFAQDYAETFELASPLASEEQLHKQASSVFYRLTEQATSTGQTTKLQYRHAKGQLSDIVSGELHVQTRLDAQGRIESLWQIRDGEALRQLANYTYADQADGSSDLIAAQDEHDQQWTYSYLAENETDAASQSTHLVTRYSDRTARNIYLQWIHGEGFDGPALTATNSATAKAWKEQADDGSFDTTLIWNKHIRLTTVIDAHGAQTKYFFDALGYMHRVVYPEVTVDSGVTLSYEEWFFRDENKNIETHFMTDGGIERFDWDEHSNLLSHTRADGSTVHYAYDEEDHLTGIADAEGHHWLRSYSGPNLTEEIDPLGNKTEYAYNEAGLPNEITDAKGGKKQLAYNQAGQLTAYTDCSGKTTTWSYDNLGQLASTTNAAGETTRYSYQRGQLATITAPDGAVQHLHYDAEGRLLQHTDPLGQTTQYSYTQAGLIAGRKDALGHTLGYQWDKTGRLTALQNENHQLHTFAYDPAGKLLKEVHFDGIETRYIHTPETGVLAEVLEGNSATLLEFDPVGRLLERKTGLMHPVQHTDPATGVRYTTQQVQADTITTDHYAYDGNGLLTDASNSHIQLQWFHDAAGNLTSEHHHYAAEGAKHTAVWHHQYDALGNRIATIRPDGQHIQWLTYGSGHIHGLLINGEEQLAYERDDLHREIERHQANRLTYTQQWDEAGRLKAQLLSKQQPGSNPANNPAGIGNTESLHIQRQYRYDKAGQLTGIADTRRGQIHYKYDPVGRLLEANSKLGDELFAFDPASNILDKNASQSLHHGNGNTAIQAGDASNRQGHSYSTLTGPRILTNLLKHYAGTHYQYDERGNLIERIHNGITTTFTWNAANQMTSSKSGEITTRYQYDPLGRRIAKIKTNQLNPGQSQHTLYGWDGDQLAWESTHTHLTEQAQQHIRNLRASGQDMEVPPPSGTTHYIFEPDSFIPVLQGKTSTPMREHMLGRPKSFVAEYTDENGDYSMDADPLFNGEYDPQNQTAELTNICIYQCDHLGTPMELTDENGNIAWSAEYKAWGEAKVQSLWTTARAKTQSLELETVGSSNQTISRSTQVRNPFRFQGQYFDDETGLHYNRFRYYDPHSGRFVSRDPIGLLGGINTFQYAPNPTEWIDPLGLIKCSGATTGGLKRATPEWRSRYGPAAMREHHLIPQVMLSDPAFMNRLKINGVQDPSKYVHRQVALLDNEKHCQIHKNGWNRDFQQWFASNPNFSQNDLQKQLGVMMRKHNISASSRNFARLYGKN